MTVIEWIAGAYFAIAALHLIAAMAWREIAIRRSPGHRDQIVAVAPFWRACFASVMWPKTFFVFRHIKAAERGKNEPASTQE